MILGRTPADVLPFDSASVLNVTFTYGGPQLNQPAPGMEGVSQELGTFQVFSRFSGLGLIKFASEGVKNSGFAEGASVGNVGSTAGPLADGGIGATVPEPSVWAMLLIGFGGIGVSIRRRKQISVAA